MLGVNELTKQFIKDYSKESDKLADSFRNKPRIEIPSAFSVAYLAQKKTLDARKLLDLLLKHQYVDGYWLEYSYEALEEPVGYYGAIPTSFCILALLKGYQSFNDKKYLYAAIKACDYLYSKEKKGYFFKATNNKSDVINTNLLAGLALLETSKLMNQASRRKEIYKAACARAIRRALNSQKCNGAYPYTSYGLTVPFLYHSMTLALLINLSNTFNDRLLDYSIKKGLRFLKKIIKKDGSIDWQKEKFQDKSGAVWTYAFNYNIFSSLGQKELVNKTLKQLNRLKGKKYLVEGDFTKQEDKFYTAWSLLAISLAKNKKLNKGGFTRYYLLKIFKIPKNTLLITKYFARQLLSFGLDKGPIEYW
ncbi:hypothetical protein GOV04_03785 [Candidatus Woesearchaeota archaeon]|nr:hypothetical protein [Candidatus Woesearchaeota archaeon]